MRSLGALVKENFFWSGTVEQWTETKGHGFNGRWGNMHFFHSRSQIIGEGDAPLSRLLGGCRPPYPPASGAYDSRVVPKLPP